MVLNFKTITSRRLKTSNVFSMKTLTLVMTLAVAQYHLHALFRV